MKYTFALAAIAAASSVSALAVHEIQSSPGYNCVPGMSCWPTDSEWQAFNRSINGGLYATVPWAKPCFSGLSFGTDFNLEQCNYIQSHYADNPLLGSQYVSVGAAREAQYGSNQNLQWETCGAADCLLQSEAPQIAVPLLRNCSLGRLASRYVDARQPSQVVATIKFCKKHNIHMSIKNTGADYLGRSSQANSLALWTHNMNQIQYLPSFTSSCPAASAQNVGIMGASVNASSAEAFFTSKGIVSPR
jgi:hypothetical protein